MVQMSMMNLIGVAILALVATIVLCITSADSFKEAKGITVVGVFIVVFLTMFILFVGVRIGIRLAFM